MRTLTSAVVLSLVIGCAPEASCPATDAPPVCDGDRAARCSGAYGIFVTADGCNLANSATFGASCATGTPSCAMGTVECTPRSLLVTDCAALQAQCAGLPATECWVPLDRDFGRGALEPWMD